MVRRTLPLKGNLHTLSPVNFVSVGSCDVRTPMNFIQAVFGDRCQIYSEIETAKILVSQYISSKRVSDSEPLFGQFLSVVSPPLRTNDYCREHPRRGVRHRTEFQHYPCDIVARKQSGSFPFNPGRRISPEEEVDIPGLSIPH